MGLAPISGSQSQFTSAELALLIAFADGVLWMPPETPVGAIDGSNVTYTLSYTPMRYSGTLDVNGQSYSQGTDWSISGNTITMTTPLDISFAGLPFRFRGMNSVSPSTSGSSLLLEDGTGLLLEDGTSLLLET